MIRKPQRSFGFRVGPDTEFSINAMTMWSVITMLLGGTVFCTRFYYQTMEDHTHLTAISEKIDAAIESSRQARNDIRELGQKLENNGIITSRIALQGKKP